MTEPLTAETFLPYVKKTFRVKGGRHVLTLSEVNRMDARGIAALARQPFTLILAGPPGVVLPEGMHILEVEDGRTFELYVIPIQTFARDRQDYQIVFN
jgi:hypothetical protein